MNDTTDDLLARSTRRQGVRVCTAAPAAAQPLRRSVRGWGWIGAVRPVGFALGQIGLTDFGCVARHRPRTTGVTSSEGGSAPTERCPPKVRFVKLKRRD